MDNLKDLEEMSSTGGGAGSAGFTPGTGMQYATPFAFKPIKKYKYISQPKPSKNTSKYKLVPNKIKGSGLEVKQLFEDDSINTPVREFQNQRIEAFKTIEAEINNMYKILSNAKNKTVEYYNENPGSFEVVYPTDIILDYIKDIKNILIE